MAFDLFRRRLGGARSISSDSATQELACLREIRAEMAASFPRVRVFRIARILRRFGLHQLPTALLVQSTTLFDGLLKIFSAQYPRLARARDWHPLFASGPYLLLNPDVASSGLSPWLHFQVFGRMEGRSPHPLIDVKVLAASMPGVPLGEVLDRYLSVPEMWTLDPSDYVDCQKFLVSGRWDGRTNPLIQLVTHHLTGPWIHQRLMLVDTAGDDMVRSRLLAAAVLLTKNGSPVSETGPQLWAQRGPLATEPGEREYTVVPGFFLGTDGTALVSTGSQVMSGDCSMIQLDGEFIGLPVGDVRHEKELIYLEGDLSRKELDDVIDQTSSGGVISPGSQRQQQVIEAVVRDRSAGHHVLQFGTQARVVANRMRVFQATHFEVPVAGWDGSEPLKDERIAIVIPERDLAKVMEISEVRRTLDAGATVCAVHEGEVWTWLPLLGTRDLVVADEALIPVLLGVVDEGKLRRLETGGAGRQL